MRRSMLFLPGNTPNIIMNADVLDADSVILDLEDAVAPDQKDAARILVRNTLKTMEFRDCEVIVRINPLSSGEWQQDLDEIIPCRPAIIMPTKISCSQDVQQIAEYMENVEKKAGNPVGSTRIMPLIETARGVENSYHIAEADPRVCAIFIGCEDLTADLCCERTKAGNEVFYARSRVVCAARAAGIDVYDTPFTDINDDAGLRKDAVFAKGLGYTGKACISPRQVDIVNEVFSPSEEDIAYARMVFEAIEEGKKLGRGAVALHGKMIDKPIVDRAAHVLEMASHMKKEVFPDD
ncbi:CoA ester lyase [Acidaminococcus fermentans]|uniref:HpcH/HpaI aldolase/citrate lyase family protein n=1 Tax=Acidaminococcus fermentans TaxID=905 RepID=UPI00242FAEBF|nr:CoA ester lyase [Acidaminococcus fermentans]